MAKQTLNWTALPNGYDTVDRRLLRLSVLVSPRLEPDGGNSPLDQFPDFVDWPATLAESTFVITYGAGPPVKISGGDTTGPTRVDDRMSLADSDVWRALFPTDTPVVGYEWRDLTKHTVLSYPTTEIDKLVRDLYTDLAASSLDQLPTAKTFLSDNKWKDLLNTLEEHDRAYTHEATGIRNTVKQFRDLRSGSLKDSLSAHLVRFQLFHTPPSKPHERTDHVPAGDPKRPAKWLGYDQTPLPTPQKLEEQMHFHKIVAAMNQYPTLLRKLGLVVDLLIPRNLLTPAAHALLSVNVELPPGSPDVIRVADASPRSQVLLDDTRFQPVPAPAAVGSVPVDNGLLVMDPNVFDLLQADVDGSGLKVMNFARSLMMLDGNVPHQQDPVTKKEREMGAPSLRNAGLMIVHKKRGDFLEATIKRQDGFNTAPPNKRIMSAQDLVRGYRIDIWDDVSKQWHSLCQRRATYDVASGTEIVNVPLEEGTVRLAATTSPDKNSNPDIIWLHETLVSWAGWSLCAPPPGKTIHHQRMGPDPDDPNKEIVVHQDPVGEPEAEVPDGLRLRTVFNAAPGTLPRLRYGRKYCLRASVVDLAGNSLDPQAGDFGPEKPKTNARAYLRFDPISAPALALVKSTPNETDTVGEGESMDRIAIRSLNDTPPLNVVPTDQRTRRFVVPNRTTQREAEQHGMLDQNGVVDPTFFTMLAAQDNSLAKELIKTAGPQGTTVVTGYAAMVEGDPLPYLPDPLAVEIAARIFNHPDFSSEQIIRIPFYDGDSWPNALPFKIETYETPADVPHYDDALRTLFVPLPKAARVTLRLSVKPSKRSLRLLGIWNWLTPAQQNKVVLANGQTLEGLALQGQHWMLTPWRNVELVHAVQRPLIDPDFLRLTIGRNPNDTYALPAFTARCSIKSTDRVDLRATWNEPFDDGPGKALGNHAHIDHAFSVKISERDSYLGTPDYSRFPPGDDRIAVNEVAQPPDIAGERHFTPKFHEFHDTRYRRIEYWLEATTKFREFMAPSLLTDKDGEPTEEHIRVIGKTSREWVPASAPPPAPQVLYVVPTFGWVRSGDDANKQSWRRGGGLRVYLDRPWNCSGYGEMLAVVLPRPNFNGDPDEEPAQKPLKNFVTQWGSDPIWLSAEVPGIAPKVGNFPLARTERDPDGKWLPKFAPPEEADQRPGKFETTALVHPDFPNPPATAKADVAPHDVFYDEERQLWYCDIEVSFVTSYFPFIRLALARYQPEALPTAHLSNVVLADFMPLVPDRWLSVVQTANARTRNVRVFGHTYSDSGPHQEAEQAPSASFIRPGQPPLLVQPPDVAPTSVVEVWVEFFDPELGEDFGWKRDSGVVVQKGLAAARRPPFAGTVSSARLRAETLVAQREFEALAVEGLLDLVFITPTLWEGSVTLPAVPASGIDRRRRLVIAEYEEYIVDDEDDAYDRFIKTKGRRLVFIEYVEL
jgi:hypothetical protein